MGSVYGIGQEKARLAKMDRHLFTGGHARLVVESRRGQGDWEEIGILGGRALRGSHPARHPPPRLRGQPEVREYRARFFDGTKEISGRGEPAVRRPNSRFWD